MPVILNEVKDLSPFLFSKEPSQHEPQAKNLCFCEVKSRRFSAAQRLFRRPWSRFQRPPVIASVHGHASIE
jgi:hypothetical protein